MSRGAVKTILFDLDETLILEKPVALRALEQTGQRAHTEASVHPAELRDRVLERAGELWRSTPAIDYCRRVGISSWEGLWCEFAGENENLVWLRGWLETISIKTSPERKRPESGESGSIGKAENPATSSHSRRSKTCSNCATSCEQHPSCDTLGSRHYGRRDEKTLRQ